MMIRGDIDYMRYSLNTGCKECDGTGYLLEGIVPVFGDCMSGLVICCPHCNKAEILPRDVCRFCNANPGEVPALGTLVQGTYFNWDYERMHVIKAYLCDQHIQLLESDGAKLRY